MGTPYNEESSPSILVLYSSDNDSPDKFFPADPRLIQAHWDSQAEPRQPPTPPASPVSGIATPSSAITAELWEMERSLTPLPTRDSPMPEIQDRGNQQHCNILTTKNQPQVDQISNGGHMKSSISFQYKDTPEYSLYRKWFDDDELEFYLEGMESWTRRKKRVQYEYDDEEKEIDETPCCFLCPTSRENVGLMRKVVRFFTVTRKPKKFRRLYSFLRRFRHFTPQFGP